MGENFTFGIVVGNEEGRDLYIRQDTTGRRWRTEVVLNHIHR